MKAKKHFVLIVIIGSIFYSSSIYAQYEAQKWYIIPKMSFANFGDGNDWKGYSSDRIPPFQIQIDHGLTRIFSVGGIVGFYRNKYVSNTISLDKHIDYAIGLGGIGSYHFAESLERLFNYGWDLSDFDIYLSFGARVEYYNVKNKKTDSDSNVLNTKDNGIRLRGGPSLGIRYYLNPSFAMLIDAGWAEMGIISMGVSWKIYKKKHYTM